jgi:hypothetical protein
MVVEEQDLRPDTVVHTHVGALDRQEIGDLVCVTISTGIGAAWSDAFVRDVASHA